MQKKLLVTLIASAFAGAAGVAVAGPISVGTVNTYASEGLANATTVAVANVAYQLTNPIAVNSVNTFTYKLDAGVGVLANCPTLANPNTAAAPAGGTLGVTAISADGSTCSYPYTNGTAPIPANTILSFTTGKTNGLAALASSGKVVATIGVLDSTSAAVAGEGNNVTVALSANAFSLSAVNSANFTTANSGQSKVESSRLDVTVSPAASAFTAGADVTPSTTVIDVGAILLTDTAGRLGPDATAFNLTTVSSESITVTVGGPFVNGAVVSITSDPACTAVLAGPATITAGATSAKLTFVPTTTTGMPFNAFACYTAPTPAAAMNPGQFTVAATYDSKFGVVPVQNSTVTLATSNVYNLALNGVRIDIRNHIPTSVTGWTNAYRIINTGAVAASFSAAYIGVDGTVGSSSVIAANVPAGGTVVVSVPQVEAVLGAAPAGAPAGVGPRLRITAPTDSARVQVYGVQPNGSIFVNSDAQGVDGGGTDK